MRGQPRQSWWEGRFYPDAGELIGWRCVEADSRPREAPEGGRVVTHREVWASPAGSAADSPEPSSQTNIHLRQPALESNRERAARRARTKVRRYAASNKLDRLVVLTWASQSDDLGKSKRDVRNFVRHGLRGKLRYRGPYVIGWERHKSGAWHANVLVSRYIRHEALQRAWGHGFVWIVKFRPRRGEGGRAAARRAAAYVAKYVSKDFDGAPAHGHRYEVAQGFAAREVRVFALSASGLIEECGARCTRRFYAAAPEAGRGPPIVWAAFA